jgi:hypothetical protein
MVTLVCATGLPEGIVTVKDIPNDADCSTLIDLGAFEIASN